MRVFFVKIHRSAGLVRLRVELREGHDAGAVVVQLLPELAQGAAVPASTQAITDRTRIAFRGASAASDEKCEARAFEERAQRATRMRVR